MTEHSGDVFWWFGEQYPIETATDDQLRQITEVPMFQTLDRIKEFTSEPQFKVAMNEIWKRYRIKPLADEEYLARAQAKLQRKVEAVLGPRPLGVVQRVLRRIRGRA